MKEIPGHTLLQEASQNQRTVILCRESIVGEKLVAQASFFIQEGLMFDTLRNAVQEGRAHVKGEVIMEENKEESFWDSLPDFGHSLDLLLQGTLDHDVLHVDVDSYFG